MSDTKYTISIYDFEKDLIERFEVSTIREVDNIIQSHYKIKREARYYDVVKTQIIERGRKEKFNADNSE